MSNKNGAKNDNRNGQGKNNNSNNNRSGQAKSGGKRKRKSRKKPKLDPLKYWGDPGALPTRDDYALDSPDPTAVIRSLGKAPIPGKNSAPELYFEVLYTRAAGLAQALAFAGDLNSADDAESTEDAVEA